MLVRPALLPDDADDLASVYFASASHHAQLDPGRYRVPDRAQVADHYVSLRLDGITRVILAADLDGSLAGFVELHEPPPAPSWSMLRPERRAHLDVAVLAEHRGRGVGHALLQAADSWAREHHVAALVLDALSANTRALSFYEQCGYRELGALMEKSLRR